MPAYSTLRSFVNALKTGDTNITKTLEKLCNDREKRQKYAADISAPHFPQGQLPGWSRNEMVQAGMSQAEVDHVERWPDSEKEKVRQQLLNVMGRDTDIHFSWALQDGEAPLTDVRRDPKTQDVRCVFLSPRSGVKLDVVNFGSIHVEA